MLDQHQIEQIWRDFLTTGEVKREHVQRQIFRLMPGFPRCLICYAPFQGLGGVVARSIYHKRPSHLNPKLCDFCEQFAVAYSGGAEVELSLLFADVRGSTTLAERISPTEFRQLIDRFYTTVTRIMVHSNALIDKIIGDQAAAMYVPGLAGPGHARRAIEAGREILRATGHGRPEGPWIPLGLGVHTGVAFVGAVGSESGTANITVLGDAANTAARLASSAGVGEILVSDAAFQAAALDLGDLETRRLELKGKYQPVLVHVLV